MARIDTNCFIPRIDTNFLLRRKSSKNNRHSQTFSHGLTLATGSAISKKDFPKFIFGQKKDFPILFMIIRNQPITICGNSVAHASQRGLLRQSDYQVYADNLYLCARFPKHIQAIERKSIDT